MFFNHDLHQNPCYGMRLGTGGQRQCDYAWAENYHDTWDDYDGLDSCYCLDAPHRLPAGSTVPGRQGSHACYSRTATRD